MIRLGQECEEYNSPKEAEYHPSMDAWVQRGGPEPRRPFLPDCYERQQIPMKRYESLERETVGDTYWREGYLN
jgi:hypothetical protein